MSLLDWLPWIANWHARRALVEAEAIELVARHAPEEAYQLARSLMKFARSKDDDTMDAFYSKVALIVADLTGRNIGPIDTYAGQERYGPPRREIVGDRTRRVRSSIW